MKTWHARLRQCLAMVTALTMLCGLVILGAFAATQDTFSPVIREQPDASGGPEEETTFKASQLTKLTIQYWLNHPTSGDAEAATQEFSGSALAALLANPDSVLTLSDGRDASFGVDANGILDGLKLGAFATTDGLPTASLSAADEQSLPAVGAEIDTLDQSPWRCGQTIRLRSIFAYGEEETFGDSEQVVNLYAVWYETGALLGAPPPSASNGDYTLTYHYNFAGDNPLSLDTWKDSSPEISDPRTYVYDGHEPEEGEETAPISASATEWDLASETEYPTLQDLSDATYYHFVGWSKNAKAKTPDWKAGDTVAISALFAGGKQTADLYAIWEKEYTDQKGYSLRKQACTSLSLGWPEDCFTDYSFPANASGKYKYPVVYCVKLPNGQYWVNMTPTSEYLGRAGYTFKGWGSSRTSLSSVPTGEAVSDTAFSFGSLYGYYEKDVTFSFEGNSKTLTGALSGISGEAKKGQGGYLFDFNQAKSLADTQNGTRVIVWKTSDDVDGANQDEYELDAGNVYLRGVGTSFAGEVQTVTVDYAFDNDPGRTAWNVKPSKKTNITPTQEWQLPYPKPVDGYRWLGWTVTEIGSPSVSYEVAQNGTAGYSFHLGQRSVLATARWQKIGEADFSVAPIQAVYNGQPHLLQVTGVSVSDGEYVTVNKKTDYSFVDAMNEKVTVRVIGANGNTLWKKEDVEVAIAKRPVNISVVSQTFPFTEGGSTVGWAAGAVPGKAESGLVTGHSAAVTLKNASRIEPNSQDVTVDRVTIATGDGKDVTKNYDINRVDGTITIASADYVAYAWSAGAPSGIGNPPARARYGEGAEVALPADPAKVSNYRWLGWLVEDENGEIPVANGKFLMPTPAKPVTVTGVWEEMSYTVSGIDIVYDGNAHSLAVTGLNAQYGDTAYWNGQPLDQQSFLNAMNTTGAVTVRDNGGNEWTQAATVSISPRPVRFLVVSAIAPEDGTPHSATWATAKVEGNDQSGLAASDQAAVLLNNAERIAVGRNDVTFDEASLTIFRTGDAGRTNIRANYTPQFGTGSVEVTAVDTGIATVGYRIEYYYNGVLNPEQTETGNGTVGELVTNIPDKKAANQRAADNQVLALTLEEDEDSNVLSVYYVNDTPTALIVESETPLAAGTGSNSGLGNIPSDTELPE